jgi:hypothetical protein
MGAAVEVAEDQSVSSRRLPITRMTTAEPPKLSPGGGRRWWAHLRWTRKNIKPTFSNQEIEEHPNIWEKCDFLAGSPRRGSGAMVVTVARGGRSVPEISHGLDDGGRTGGRLSDFTIGLYQSFLEW